MRLVVAATASLVLISAASEALADDAAKAMFAGRCGACHQIATAKSGPMAPSLKGVVGRKIASLADYSYSSALKAKAGNWTDANLQAFLAGPSTFVPGTKMPIAVAGAVDRTTLIAYLKTVK